MIHLPLFPIVYSIYILKHFEWLEGDRDRAMSTKLALLTQQFQIKAYLAFGTEAIFKIFFVICISYFLFEWATIYIVAINTKALANCVLRSRTEATLELEMLISGRQNSCKSLYFIIHKNGWNAFARRYFLFVQNIKLMNRTSGCGNGKAKRKQLLQVACPSKRNNHRMGRHIQTPRFNLMEWQKGLE